MFPHSVPGLIHHMQCNLQTRGLQTAANLPIMGYTIVNNLRERPANIQGPKNLPHAKVAFNQRFHCTLQKMTVTETCRIFAPYPWNSVLIRNALSSIVEKVECSFSKSLHRHREQWSWIKLQAFLLRNTFPVGGAKILKVPVIVLTKFGYLSCMIPLCIPHSSKKSGY